MTTLSHTYHKQTVQEAGRLVCQTGSCPGLEGEAHVLPKIHKNDKITIISNMYV